RAQRHPELRAVLGRTELNVADGMPVVWLSRLVGRPVPGRVAGADMAPLLVAEAAASGASVFLLGGEHGVAEAAAERLTRQRAGLEWLHRLVAEPRRLAGRHASGMAWLVLLSSRSLFERARSARPRTAER